MRTSPSGKAPVSRTGIFAGSSPVVRSTKSAQFITIALVRRLLREPSSVRLNFRPTSAPLNLYVHFSRTSRPSLTSLLACPIILSVLPFAPIAQLDRASGFYPEGSGFESSLGHQTANRPALHIGERADSLLVRRCACPAVCLSVVPTRISHRLHEHPSRQTLRQPCLMRRASCDAAPSGYPAGCRPR